MTAIQVKLGIKTNHQFSVRLKNGDVAELVFSGVLLKRVIYVSSNLTFPA